MNDTKEKEAIKKVIEDMSKKYSALSPDCISDLIQSAKIVTVVKSELIVKEGQNSDKLYFIIKGCVRVFYYKDGKDISDWFGFENDFVSSIVSFFNSVPSPHYIQTLEPTTYLELARGDLFKLMEKYHCFETLARKAITQTMLQLQHRIVSLQFETAQQRYDNLFSMRHDIIQRVPLINIASYLGITIETLSRIRSRKSRI